MPCNLHSPNGVDDTRLTEPSSICKLKVTVLPNWGHKSGVNMECRELYQGEGATAVGHY